MFCSFLQLTPSQNKTPVLKNHWKNKIHREKKCLPGKPGGDNVTKPKLQECQQLVFPPLGKMQRQLHPPRCSGGGNSSRELFLLAGLGSFSHLPSPAGDPRPGCCQRGKQLREAEMNSLFFLQVPPPSSSMQGCEVISQASLAVHKCSHISLLVMNGEELKIGACYCFDELSLMRELWLQVFLGMLPFTSEAPRSTEMIIFSWQVENQS